MAKAKEKTETKGSGNWYRVLQDSFINDAIRHEGEYVQYDGEAGSNLQSVSEDEVRKAGIEIKEPTDDALDNREAELNQREKELVKREQTIQIREKELDDLTEAADKRAKELDDREAAIAAKETPVDTTPA